MAKKEPYIFEGGFKWYLKLPKGLLKETFKDLLKVLGAPLERLISALANLINQIRLWIRAWPRL